MTNLVGILCGDKIFKRAFSCGLLFVLVSTLFIGSFTSVLAQGGGADSGGAANPAPLPIGGPGTFPIGGNGGGNTGGAVPGGNGSSGGTDDFRQTAAEAANQQAALAAQGVGSTPDGVLGLFHTYVLTGLGWVVGQAGSAFDYAIENFIVGFGRLYITGTGETIDRLWGTVRDIFNLTFIFGLVYIGFKMILDSSDSSARKMLVSLIGAALLVNFSLFITKFVIDFSNIAATQVYNAFATDSASGQLSITNGFMTIMGINSLIGVEYTAGGSFAYVIGMLIIFAILAYVFLAGAIMIIIRFVALNIYMVFSPFMFLGWVFPALSGYSRDYWSGFLRQAFFAPAFIFMLYLSYVVASTFPAQRNLGTMFNPNGTSTLDVPSLIPYFAMVIVFLCASLVVAKKMGAHGSTMAVSVGKNISGRARGALGAAAGGATFGMAARLGRNTVGASASAAANSEWMRRNSTKFGRVGKGFYNATAAVADSSFDARKVGGTGKMLGIGEGKKGGFTTRLKEDKESNEKFLKAIGTRDADKFDYVTKAAKADLERLEDLADKETNIVKKAELLTQIATAKKSYDTAKNNYSAREEYKHQLAYAKATESWQKTQLAIMTAAGGAAAGILTGGMLPAVAALAVGGAASVGSNYNNKQVTGALRKEYGKNGLKKRKNNHEEHSLKKALAALGEHNDHGEKPKDKSEGAGHGSASAAKPTPKANYTPAPTSSKPSGGDNHGHH